jgi:hypothetical protein
VAAVCPQDKLNVKACPAPRTFGFKTKNRFLLTEGDVLVGFTVTAEEPVYAAELRSKRVFPTLLH